MRPDSGGPVTDSERLKAQDASRLLRVLPAMQAATVLRPLIAMMPVGGGHSVEIEVLQANAWLAICTLVKSLEKHRGATDDRWERAMSNVEVLETLLI
jgi:hypothetical protein